MARKSELPEVILKTPVGPIKLSIDTDEHAADLIELEGGNVSSGKWISNPFGGKVRETIPITYRGRRYDWVRLYLRHRDGRWSCEQSKADITSFANRGQGEKLRYEKISEDERRAVIDSIVPTALQYIDEHFEDFDRDKLERAIFEHNRDEAVLCLRERIEDLDLAAQAVSEVATGLGTPCRGPRFATLRKSLQAQSKELRTVAKRTRTMARNVATMPYSTTHQSAEGAR